MFKKGSLNAIDYKIFKDQNAHLQKSSYNPQWEDNQINFNMYNFQGKKIKKSFLTVQ